MLLDVGRWIRLLPLAAQINIPDDPVDQIHIKNRQNVVDGSFLEGSQLNIPVQ